MADTLADFHALVSSAIAKGTKYNTTIPTYVRMAAKWLERNYTFKYMEMIDTTNYDIVANTFRYTAPTGVKAYKDYRYITDVDPTDSDVGTWKSLQYIDPQDLGGRVTKAPLTFYLEGRDSIVLGEKPDAAYAAELWYYRFSSWPSTIYTTTTIAVTDVQAATADDFSMTIGSISVTDLDVSAATDGATLASAIQTGLRAADAAATVISATWANNVLTITDTTGRLHSGVSLVDASEAQVGGAPSSTVAPWLVTDADDVLLGQTIVMMSAFLQDADLKAMYTSIRDEGLKTITISEDDLIYRAQDNEMQYGDLQYNDPNFGLES